MVKNHLSCSLQNDEKSVFFCIENIFKNNFIIGQL